MSELLATANAVKSIVAPGPIPGSRLSALLKAQVPDWAQPPSGCVTCASSSPITFSDVVVAGRSGMAVTEVRS